MPDSCRALFVLPEYQINDRRNGIVAVLIAGRNIADDPELELLRGEGRLHVDPCSVFSQAQCVAIEMPRGQRGGE